MFICFREGLGGIGSSYILLDAWEMKSGGVRRLELTSVMTKCKLQGKSDLSSNPVTLSLNNWLILSNLNFTSLVSSSGKWGVNTILHRIGVKVESVTLHS